MASIYDMMRSLRTAEQQLTVLIPKVAAIVKIEGLKFIGENFAKQGFQKGGGGVSAWQKRKIPKSLKKQNQDAGRAILVKRGHLRRRWDSDTNVQGSKVVFQNNMPYAEVHNEGGKAGRGSGFQMPQRQMIGDSSVLDSMVERKVTDVMDKIFN